MSLSNLSKFDNEIAKAKMKAIKALGLTTTIQDILITLDSQVQIIDMVEYGEYFIYLAVGPDITNLSVTRVLLKSIRKISLKNYNLSFIER